MTMLLTRSSDVGDKPRDAFMQHAMAWLTPKNTTPSPCWYCWSF